MLMCTECQSNFNADTAQAKCPECREANIFNLVVEIKIAVGVSRREWHALRFDDALSLRKAREWVTQNGVGLVNSTIISLTHS